MKDAGRENWPGEERTLDNKPAVSSALAWLGRLNLDLNMVERRRRDPCESA